MSSIRRFRWVFLIGLLAVWPWPKLALLFLLAALFSAAAERRDRQREADHPRGPQYARRRR